MSGGQLRANTQAFIDAEVYSDFILENLHDAVLSDTFYRNVSDFPSGTTLNIKTVGKATLQDVEEDKEISYAPIDTGTVTLNIQNHVGDGWYVPDELREDGSQIEQLMSMRSMESLRAIDEVYETTALSTLNNGQTADDLNEINGFPHRFVAGGTNNTFTIADIAEMKLAFDKANVPQQGRVFMVDPVVEATLNKLFTSTNAVDRNPQFQDLLEGGLGREKRFLFNFMGFDFIMTNRLPRIASETIDSTTVSNGVANIAFSVLDDNTKPLMGAWRRPPRIEAERYVNPPSDRFVTTARWGWGTQRDDTLGVILTSSTATE